MIRPWLFWISVINLLLFGTCSALVGQYIETLSDIERETGMSHGFLKANLFQMEVCIKATGWEGADKRGRQPAALANQFASNDRDNRTSVRNRRNRSRRFHRMRGRRRNLTSSSSEEDTFPNTQEDASRRAVVSFFEKQQEGMRNYINHATYNNEENVEGDAVLSSISQVQTEKRNNVNEEMTTSSTKKHGSIGNECENDHVSSISTMAQPVRRLSNDDIRNIESTGIVTSSNIGNDLQRTANGIQDRNTQTTTVTARKNKRRMLERQRAIDNERNSSTTDVNQQQYGQNSAASEVIPSTSEPFTSSNPRMRDNSDNTETYSVGDSNIRLNSREYARQIQALRNFERRHQNRAQQSSES